MKMLIWKELREQRYIPIAHGALVMVVIAVWYGMSAWAAAHYTGGRPLTANETVPVLYIGLCILGLFCGSGAFAPEIGAGTLAFLATVPTRRGHIWWAKVISGLITIGASALAVLIAYCLTVIVLFGIGAPRGAFTGNDFGWMLAVVLICAIYGYAACLFVSSLVDRTVVAASIGLVIAIGGIATFGGLLSVEQIRTIHLHDGELIAMAILAMPAIAFFIASYVGFCSGSVLLPGLRFRRSAAVLSSGLAISAVVLMLIGVAMNTAAAAIDARHLAEQPRVLVLPNKHDKATTLQFDFPNGATISEDTVDMSVPHGTSFLTEKQPPVSLVFGNPTHGRSKQISTNVSDDYLSATLRNPGDVRVKVRRHALPGTYHEQINLLDKAGATVHVINVENVTE